MSMFNTPKNEKIVMKCTQNRRCTSSSMCEHSLYKFENKGMITFGVTDYTKEAPKKCCRRTYLQDRHFEVPNGPLPLQIMYWVAARTDRKKSSSTPLKNEKILMKCAQNRRCTSSMCEQSLRKV